MDTIRLRMFHRAQSSNSVEPYVGMSLFIIVENAVQVYAIQSSDTSPGVCTNEIVSSNILHYT